MDIRRAHKEVVAADLPPRISILLECLQPDRERLKRALESLDSQQHSNWELLVCAEANSPGWLAAGVSPRPGGQSAEIVVGASPQGNFESALGKCRGEFVAIVNKDAILEPDALSGWLAAVGPGTAAVYSDWDHVDAVGRRHTPRFTPEFSPELLAHTLYWGRCYLARTAALREVNRPANRPGKTQALPLEHELAFRLAERPAPIHRVARMLWHVQEEAAERAGSAVPPVSGPPPTALAKSTKGSQDSLGAAGAVSASIVICSKNPELLRKCLKALLPTLGGRHEVIVVAHQTGDGPALERVAASHGVRLVPYEGAFHFGIMNGLGVKASSGQALCFLNDDVYPVAGDWLDSMLALATRPNVGVVGALLLYPNGTIQHAGVTVGGGNYPSHVGRFEVDSPYWPWLRMTREVAAVTGACMVLRRTVWDELDGFDPRFPANYNDTDLCLRAGERGYRVLLEGRAVLTHEEGQTRNPAVRDEERELFSQRWGPAIAAPDKFFTPQLSLGPLHPVAGAQLYGANDGPRHCAPVPSERSAHSPGYFSDIAETLVRSERPARVFDAGCGCGFLVEAFRDRGVDAWGVDISSSAIGQVRPDLKAYCRVASLTEPIEGFYDLVTCIQVLEQMPENEAHRAIRNLCAVTGAILFSSTLSNLRPIVSWLRLFSEQGFAPDIVFDASFVAPQAFLLRRQRDPLPVDVLMLFSEKLRTQAENQNLATELAKVSRERATYMQTATTQLVQATALGKELADIHSSPGWRFIRKYRDWLHLSGEFRPWVVKFVEPAAHWFLQRTARPAPSSQTSANGISALTGPAEPEGFPYADWIAEQEPDVAGLAVERELAKSCSYQPKISIVVPVYKVPFEIVEEMLASVLAQTYTNWELCLAHGDPEAAKTRQYLTSLAGSDPRIKVSLLDKNRGISGNSNQALTLATGEFIALLDHDDTLAPFALFEILQALNEDPSIDFLYSDRDKIKDVGGAIQRLKPLLKPQWSPEMLLCANYLTHFNVIATEHIRAIGGWREETDGAQDWDLFLRATSRARNIRHIPKVLYHWRQIPTSVAGGDLTVKPYAAAAQLRTVQDHLRRQGSSAEATFDNHRQLRILWKPRPGQTIGVILVSTAADAETLWHARRLLTSSAYPPAEIVVPLAAGVLPEDPPEDARIRVIRVPSGASLAEKIRRAVEHSVAEVLVFVDQAVNPADPDWLGELAGPLENREIGIVGAKMLKPGTDNIYHAGLVFTAGSRLEYIFAGEQWDIDDRFGLPTWYRNWTAVSGACFSLRREVWDATGGLSAAPRYPRLDVDLCLKVRLQAGLRVVYNPFARFFQSRPAALEEWRWDVSQEAADKYMREVLPGGDPYFHSKLTCHGGKIGLRSRTGFVEPATSRP